MDNRTYNFIFENSDTWNKSFKVTITHMQKKVDDNYLKSEVYSKYFKYIPYGFMGINYPVYDPSWR